MDKFAIWSSMEAKPGKEKEVEEFLKSELSLIEREPGTTTFYALKIGPNTYGTFDTFTNKAARDAHVNGPAAKAVHARLEELFTSMPTIVETTILMTKAQDTRS